MESAALFGFQVYYADGTQLDVLRAAGAGEASVIAVCINDPEAASRIVDLVNSEFPGTKLYVRSFDRRRFAAMLAKGSNSSCARPIESAMVFGRKTLEALGLDAERAAAVKGS